MADLSPTSPEDSGDFEPDQEEGIEYDNEREITEPRPKAGLWLIYLFFRPKIFFRHFVVEHAPLLTALAAWLYGISGVMDQIGEELLKAEFSGRTNPYEFLLNSWYYYWLLCLLLGVIAGAIYFQLGGWWYRKRLEYSGAVEPDASLARRVYLYASLVYAIPAVLYGIWETQHYTSPGDAREGMDNGWLLIIAALFWSVYVSYRGVRTAFITRKWAARLWFAILPAALYSLSLVLVVAALLLSSGYFSEEPDISHPQTAQHAQCLVKYPSNWVCEKSTSDEYPHWLTVEPLMADAYISFTLFEHPIDPQGEIDYTYNDFVERFTVRNKQPIEYWGQYKGCGYTFEMEIDQLTYQGVSFAAAIDFGGFEVTQLCRTDASNQQPGFDMIRNSFIWNQAP